MHLNNLIANYLYRKYGVDGFIIFSEIGPDLISVLTICDYFKYYTKLKM